MWAKHGMMQRVECMKIVSMNRTHLSAVANLEEECFAHPWSENSLEDYLNNPSAHFFVALTETCEVAGYIGTYIVCDEAYITNVAVTEKSRRGGIGRELVSHAADNAERNGASFISLEVRLSNTPAVSLYKSLGFESDGIRPNFYRDPDEDALIMTKRFK